MKLYFYSKVKVLFLLISTTITFVTFGQSRTISGNVVDSASGEPLVGASVRVKGDNNGVSTNANGSFSFAVNPNATLEVSSVGYKQ